MPHDIQEQHFYPHLNGILAAVKTRPPIVPLASQANKGIGLGKLWEDGHASFEMVKDGRYRREMPPTEPYRFQYANMSELQRPPSSDGGIFSVTFEESLSASETPL